MKLQFDINNNVEDFTFILSSRGYEHYGVINNVKRDTVICKQNMNSANELSFEVYKYIDDKEERLWNKITDLKLVWVKELNEYFEIHVSLNDSITPVKTITGTSLCEAELSQTNLYGIEINTEADIERDDYVVTKFYNPDNHKGSLLHRILDKMPHYRIKHVDVSLMNLQRSFSINGTAIYDFLIGECAEQFDCLFLFDTTDRSISAYDLYTVCNDCGHRGEYNDVCPKCNSTNLKYYGEDTTIYIDKENLTDSVNLETDVGSIKNCFKLVAGDDNMTAAIRNLNPNGSDYIVCVPDWQKEDMPTELVDKLESYDELMVEYTEEYEQLAQDIYETIDDILYYESGMMPTIEQAEITASTEAAKLTKINLSPLALSTLTESTSKATVESALKNYAKAYVKTGYVKLEVNQSSFTYIGEKIDGFIHGTWTGNFKVTNYSDEEDIAESAVITIDVNDNYEDFVNQKVLKAISSEDDDEGSVFDVLSIDELDDFKEALKEYGLNRLTSFYDAIQGALDVLIQLDQAEPEADLYSVLYKPYYAKLGACQAEMDARATTIESLENAYDSLIKRKNEIQNILNFENYLGEELFLLFCSYRREDTYSNDNYISDGLDNAEIFANARKFLEVAKKELYKASQKQHTISSTLHNLLIMPEFSILTDNFELGNWIRIGIDEEIYRLRLISYEISFSDIQTLNVEFSSITKQADCVSDVQSILSSAQSMATGFSYVSKQAEKGEKTYKTFYEIQENGWNSGLIQINNNTDEEIIYGKYGIVARSHNDEIDDYDPEQLRITHNILCFTDDNWKTIKCSLGKHDYYKFDNGMLNKYTGYGLTADFVTAGYINSCQIIAGEIYSTNYSSTDKTGTYIDLNDGSFFLAGEKIVYNAKENTVTLKDTTIKWESTNAPEITNIPNLNESLEQLDGRVQTYSQTNDPSINWSETEKLEHTEDLWFNPNDGLTRRWDGSSWEVITDSELEALAKSKAQIFTTTPTPPYYVGDLWVQGSSGDIMNCIKERISGNYDESDWTKSSKYTDDTIANTAKGIADNAKKIGETLVAGLGFQETEITGHYVISPVIAGGTLLIGDTTGTYAQITTDGQLICTGANISGAITATSLTLGSGVTVSTSNISGLSSVATSGSYNDLSDTPSIPNSVEDLGLDLSTIIYKGDITQTTKTDSNGISYLETTVPSSDGNITYSTYNADDYIVFGRSKGTNSDGNDYVCISTDGLLTARNALIYGTIYATDGEFTGTITSSKISGGSITIGNNFKVTASGDVTANSFNSSNANITGGKFNLTSNSDSVIKIISNDGNERLYFSKGGLFLSDNTMSWIGNWKTEFSTMGLYSYKVTEISDTETFSEVQSYFDTLNGSFRVTGGTSSCTYLVVENNLTVNGTKSRMVNTDNYDNRLLYCYETPTPTFGDIGEGQIDETGKCYIFIDDIFAETIDTDCTYQVFLQPYGQGKCYVTERTPSYFIVEGSENLSFGWELKAIQRDYDTIRLEEYRNEESINEVVTTLSETYSYLNTLLYNPESEEINYE